ncbi:hypothetical protein [Microbispora sp. H13382]|uniref:hypothetical protein n=1 Tax=Microbispora sp. H13382 TaxID=2729112 RepID=UPI0015FF1AAE|nr:hypothetical protein [Microbispora sp. H13382]
MVTVSHQCLAKTAFPAEPGQDHRPGDTDGPDAPAGGALPGSEFGGQDPGHLPGHDSGPDSGAEHTAPGTGFGMDHGFAEIQLRTDRRLDLTDLPTA